ncbi:hypothetical protein AAFM46_12075 [Arthrobacter sp. TMP15]|uniref:hypothetical protein n=1 Tax=Arthrobacter sp. TMP15 TaxID=3140789 RepID=UPI0031BA0668
MTGDFAGAGFLARTSFSSSPGEVEDVSLELRWFDTFEVGVRGDDWPLADRRVSDDPLVWGGRDVVVFDDFAPVTFLVAP